MNYIPYADAVIDAYLAQEKPIPETVLMFYEKAKEHFGEEAVSLQDGLSAFNENSWRRELRDFVRNLYFSTHDLPLPNAKSFYQICDRFPNLISAAMEKAQIILTQRTNNFWTRYSILLHFPKRTITNEAGHSIDIFDLFVRIPICDDGSFTTRFRYLRTSYTMAQIDRGYLHSHCPGFGYTSMDILHWEDVCTGSGPINDTMARMNSQGPNMDPIVAGLFFWELDKIIGIESEVGGPYQHLDNVGKQESYVPNYSNIGRVSDPLPKDFIESYLSTDRFKVVFQNGGYCLSTSFLEWRVDFTDYLIHWANCMQTFFHRNVLLRRWLQPVVIMNNREVEPMEQLSQDARNFIQSLGDEFHMVTFKGKDFCFKVTDSLDMTETKNVLLVRRDIATETLYTFLQILNYRYGKTEKQEELTDPETFYSEVRTGKYVQRISGKKAIVL